MARSGPSSVESPGAEQPEEVLYCANHPSTETLIRCSRCLDPICLKCAVRTPVGLRCLKCARVGRSPLYILQPEHYLLATLMALALGLVAGVVVTQLGFILVALFLAMPVGGLIAEIVSRSIRGRRGRPVQVIVAACIALGAVAGPWLWRAVLAGSLAGLPSNPLIYLRALLNATAAIYIVLAIVGAVARLR